MGFIAPINENEYQPAPKRSGFFGKLQSALEDPTGGLALGAPLAAGAAISRGAAQSIIPIIKSGIEALRASVPSGQAGKDLVRNMLLKDFTDKATPFAFRGTSLDELRHIAKQGELPVGQSFEGVPGISAASISKDGLPIYGEGFGYITKGGQFAPSGRFGEVLVNPKTSPKELQFVAGDRVLGFDELRALFK